MKDILKEIVDDLEQIRVALAALTASSGDQARTAGEITAGANRAAYNKLRKRIDALPVG
jgi:hypothetical protein